MQSGIDLKTLRRSHKQGHASMTDLIFLTVPFIGRFYAQWDRITQPRLTAELLTSPAGRELLLCCGRLRVYLSPRSALVAERR